MDKATLLKRLDPILDEFDRVKMFGSIELVFRFGRASVIRKLSTEKFPNEREISHNEHRDDER